jgi:pilus assembly protein Flp/PilA
MKPLGSPAKSNAIILEGNSRLIQEPGNSRKGGGSMTNNHNGWKGQGLLEYAIILVLVAIVVLVVLVILGPAIGNMYSNVIVNV